MITETLQQDYIAAMKSKDQLTVDVIRLLTSEIKNKEIELRAEGKTLDDAAVIAVLSKEVKKRKESVEVYTAAGREELAKDEQAEIEVIARYLPAQLSEEDIKKVVDNIVANSETKDFATVMRAAMAELKGQADGKIVSEVVKNSLN